MKSNVKKICIVIISIIIILSACFFTNWISKNRANKTYNKLKTGYDNIEKSNSELQEINNGLEINNIKLRGELKNSNGFVIRTKEITTKLETEIAGAGTTIERIEITIEAIEEIVEQLPDKIIVLEKSGVDNSSIDSY